MFNLGGSANRAVPSPNLDPYTTMKRLLPWIAVSCLITSCGDSDNDDGDARNEERTPVERVTTKTVEREPGGGINDQTTTITDTRAPGEEAVTRRVTTTTNNDPGNLEPGAPPPPAPPAPPAPPSPPGNP